MAQLQRSMAGRNAAALADLDFAKDDLVRIGWQADGPNFVSAHLHHEGRLAIAGPA